MTIAYFAVLLIILLIERTKGFSSKNNFRSSLKNNFARDQQRVQWKQDRDVGVSVKRQPLFSLGDPDTNAESTFYRW